MLTIYGSMLCPDCVKCCEELTAAGVEYEYHDICADLRDMKAFLSFRDKESLFREVKDSGKIGIPCIIDPQGTVHLTWEEFM